MPEEEALAETVAILFADACGSTSLYERSTDRAALALVEACLDAGAAIVERTGSRVVRSKPW